MCHGFMVSEKPGDQPPKEHSWLQAPSRQGRLHNLYYIGPLNTTMLSEWTAATDWKKLRALNLGSRWDHQPDIQVFDYLTTQCTFEDLEKLRVDVPPMWKNEDEMAMSLAARKFLCNLRPLSDLHLADDIDCTLVKTGKA